MLKLPYTVVWLKGHLSTGCLQLQPPLTITGATLRERINQRDNLEGRRFRIYLQHEDEEVEVGDDQTLKQHELQPPTTVELREQLPSMAEEEANRKRRPTTQDTGSIAFEESSSIGNEEQQYMEAEPEPVPFVYGDVKVCRWLKCFSYEMFLELNPEIGVLNMYKQKRDCPKRPKLTIPFKQIQKIVRLKEAPCFSRKSYMKLVLPDEEEISVCFYDREICARWMKFIKQAIIFARYFEQRTSKIMSRQPELAETLVKKTNTSRIELKDSLASGSSLRKSSHSHQSQESAPEVFLNEKREIILLQDFQVDRKIGSGSFGYIFLAKHVPTGRMLALKQLSKNELVQKRQLRYALTELEVLKLSVQCPFILKLHYAFQTKDYLYMALNYCSNGNLKEMITANGKLSVEDSIIFICQLIVAIEFLHENDIIYRDMKPQNILVGNDYHLLLSDFGLSKSHIGPKDYTESFCGSPLYVAPELLIAGKCNQMADIYGIGVVMFEMVHGRTIFECEDVGDAFDKIKNEQPQIDDDLPDQLKDFLRCTLDKRPQKRPKRIRDHPLFDNVNWRHVSQKKYHPSVQFARQGSSLEWVQIDYKIDEDYNHQNYQQNRVEGWLFSTNTSAG